MRRHIQVVPAEAPGPIARSSSRGHGVWVPAFAGTTTAGASAGHTSRRAFLNLLGGAAAAWPLAARAQRAATPVIGYLNSGTPGRYTNLAEFRKGLAENGYIEGQNLAIEYRWAYNDNDRLPELAADLVSRRVDVIAIPSGATAAARAAKAATTTIPIVIGTVFDPVQNGLVASLNRPGGNLTGVAYMGGELAAKQLGLLHELLPQARRFGALVYPDARLMTPLVNDVEAAAAMIGGQVEILKAGSNREIDAAFASLAQKRIEGLLISPHVLFSNRMVQITTFATHQSLPTVHYSRDFPDGGGLMSYGASGSDQYRQVGLYVGRILKGEKPADLPILRPTRFELVINLETAKTFGIEVPPTLLAIADEVLE
jgi:putative ABC transport system substrate-binding protein